jgi:hypothetical protein
MFASMRPTWALSNASRRTISRNLPNRCSAREAASSSRIALTMTLPARSATTGRTHPGGIPSAASSSVLVPRSITSSRTVRRKRAKVSLRRDGDPESDTLPEVRPPRTVRRWGGALGVGSETVPRRLLVAP